MGALDDDIRSLLASIDELPGLWESVDVRTLAILVDGEWHNIITRCCLDHREPRKVPRQRHLPREGLATVRQQVIPLERLSLLLAEARTGKLSCDEGTILLRTVPLNATQGKVEYDRSEFYRSINLNYRGYSGPFPIAHFFSWSGDGWQGLMMKVPGGRNAIDEQLRSLDRPWDGLDALTRIGLRVQTRLEHNENVRLEVVVPLQVAFDTSRCDLLGPRLRTTVLSSPSAKKRVIIGYTGATTSGATVTGTVAPKSHRWKRVPSGFRADLETTVPRSPELTLLLRVDKLVVERLQLPDAEGIPNVRMIAHNAFDPDLRRHKETLLAPHPTKSRDFEGEVARLFMFVGFQVDLVGTNAQASDAVDVVAHSPLGDLVLVVECTTGPLNAQGKLARLVARAMYIRSEVERFDTDVLVIMVSAQPNHLVSKAERASAAEDGVLVLCREDLAQLLNMASGMVPLDQVSDLLRARYDALAADPDAHLPPLLRARRRVPR